MYFDPFHCNSMLYTKDGIYRQVGVCEIFANRQSNSGCRVCAAFHPLCTTSQLYFARVLALSSALHIQATFPASCLILPSFHIIFSRTPPADHDSVQRHQASSLELEIHQAQAHCYVFPYFDKHQISHHLTRTNSVPV